MNTSEKAIKAYSQDLIVALANLTRKHGGVSFDEGAAKIAIGFDRRLVPDDFINGLIQGVNITGATPVLFQTLRDKGSVRFGDCEIVLVKYKKSPKCTLWLNLPGYCGKPVFDLANAMDRVIANIAVDEIITNDAKKEFMQDIQDIAVAHAATIQKIAMSITA